MKLLEHFKELSLYPKNAEELKGLILQLAVQGKLTANWRLDNPNVENAESLVQSFRDEKQKLILKKKIKKEKALDPLSPVDSPFDIPSTWVWTHMIDSIHLVTKGATPTSYGYQFLPEGINFIKVECVKEGEIKPHLIDCFISEEANDNQKRSKLEAGDILFSIAGTIGATAIVKQSDLPANTNQALAIIRGSDYVYRPIYLQTLLDSFVSQNTKSKARGAAMNNISLGDLKSMIVPVPPIEEQKAIVEVVNTLIAEVEKLESLTKERVQLKESFVVSALARLTEAGNTQKEWNFLEQHFSSFLTEKKNIKSLKETILQLAVQGKLTESWRANNPKKELASELLKQIEAEKQQLIAEKRIKKEKSFPPIEDDDIPFELPNNWMWFRWVDLLGLVKYPMKRGPFGSALRKDFFVEEGVKVFEQYNAINNDPDWCRYRITNEKYEELKAFTAESGDMLISCSGTLGRICILPEGTEIGIINQALLKIRLENRIIDNEFFIKLFRSYYLQSLVYKSAMGSAITNMVGVKELKQFLMPIPPLEEQKVIVEKVNSLTALCDELEQQIETSQTQIELLMQSCLKEVFEHESN